MIDINENLPASASLSVGESQTMVTGVVRPSFRANRNADFLRTIDLVDSVFSMLGVGDEASLLGDQTGAPVAAGHPNPQTWVLAIEDDDDVAETLQLRLKKMGLSVLRAKAGIEGYCRAYSTLPAAIILDFELPGGNGDYVLRRLKVAQETRDIPVIMLTGTSKPRVEQQVRMLGVAEFLTKPLEWPKLRDALERWIPCLNEVR